MWAGPDVKTIRPCCSGFAGWMIVPAAAFGVPISFNTAGKVIVDSRSTSEVRIAYDTKEISFVPYDLLWCPLAFADLSAIGGWPTFTFPTAVVGRHLLSRLVTWEQIISDERKAKTPGEMCWVLIRT